VKVDLQSLVVMLGQCEVAVVSCIEAQDLTEVCCCCNERFGLVYLIV